MEISQDKLNDFEKRLLNWTSRQGLLFQLKHGIGGKGSGGVLWNVLWKAFSRLFLLTATLLIIGLGTLYYQTFRSDYSHEIQHRLATFLSLPEQDVTIRGYKRNSSEITLNSIWLTGDPRTFFDDLKLSGISFSPGQLAGLGKNWNLQTIDIVELNALLKVGGLSEDAEKAAYQSLFRKPENSPCKRIECKKATLRWGEKTSANTPTTLETLSEDTHLREMRTSWTRNQGRITDTQLTANRQDNGWKVKLSGGKLYQNWCQGFPIKSAQIELLQDRIIIEHLHLEVGSSLISITGTIQQTEDDVEFSLHGDGTDLLVRSLLPSSYHSLISGHIDAHFQVTGSLDRVDGLSTEMDLTVTDSQGIAIYDEIDVLRIISALDQTRMYRKVHFTQGSLHVQLTHGEATFSKINLTSSDPLKLTGKFKAIQSSHSTQNSPNPTEQPEMEEPTDTSTAQPTADPLSLRSYAQLTQKENERQHYLQNTPANQQHTPTTLKQHWKPELTTYEGHLNLGLPPNALDRYQALKDKFPLDDQARCRWIHMVIHNDLSDLGQELDNLIKQLRNTNRPE